MAIFVELIFFYNYAEFMLVEELLKLFIFGDMENDGFFMVNFIDFYEVDLCNGF